MAHLTKDIRLAAEIGQSLVQSNNDYKARLEKMSSHKSDFHTIQDLEQVQMKLQEQIHELQEALHESKESEKSLIKKQITLEGLYADSLGEVDRLVKMDYNHKSTIKKLELEKAQDLAQMAELQTHAKESLLNYQKSRDQVQQLVRENHELASKVQDLEEEKLVLESHVQELQTLTANHNDLIQESESQKALLEELQWDLERTRESLNASNARLSSMESGAVLSTLPSKSLLSEVDEQRQVAVEQHSALTQKHQGLLKAHSVTIQQQERMRNHISRLTQLSQNQSAEHRVGILEDALGQALSENQALAYRLLNLEKSGDRRTSFDDDSCDSQTDSVSEHAPDHDTLTNLRLRVSQLITQNDQLSMELKTLHMIKLNESDKVRAAYTVIHERELELDQLRCQFAKVKFDLDEMRLRRMHPELDVDLENIQGNQEEKVDIKKEIEKEDVRTQDAVEIDTSTEEISSLSMDSITNPDLREALLSVTKVSVVKEKSVQESSPMTSPTEAPRTRKTPKKVILDRTKMGQECNQQ